MREIDAITYECGHCHTHVRGTVVGGAADGTDPSEGPYSEWLLTTCANCRRPNLVGREYYGELDGEEYWEVWRIYPPRDRILSLDVPDGIRAAFAEAQTNLRVGSLLSTALMCRRAVELLARDRGVRSGTLEQKLEKLRDNGEIDPNLYEWADALRHLGNDAAHDEGSTFSITKEDAADLLAFTEALIDYVYIYRARYKKFLERRG